MHVLPETFHPSYSLRRVDYTVRLYFTGNVYQKVANVFRRM